jgi:RimJ/RimL family protein N-acetyltransferase
MLAGADRLPTIITPRLQLRWLEHEDIAALWDVFSDPEVCRYWSHPAMTDRSAATALRDEIVHCFAKRTLFQWGIAERATNRVVGTCTLAGLASGHRRAELGYALARHAWGQGYIAEALPALFAFAFETLGLHRLEADVDPRNARSVRALERLGFQREGHQRERYFLSDEWQDALLYGLLEREWAARKSINVNAGEMQR